MIRRTIVQEMTFSFIHMKCKCLLQSGGRISRVHIYMHILGKRERHLLICLSRNEANLVSGQEANLCMLGLHFTVSDNPGGRGLTEWADRIHFPAVKCGDLRSPQQAC